MRNAIPRGFVVLALLTNALVLTNASPIDHPPVDGAGYANVPKPGPAAYVCPDPDGLNIVDLTCSANDACGGKEHWPVLTLAQSSGNVGGSSDPGDWSSVELYRAETLVLTGSNGLVMELGIGCATSTGSSLLATQNGWYDLRVSADVHAYYTLKYEVVANDALSGKDAPHNAADAHFISAIPRTLDPTRAITYPGSLPNREDQPLGPDQDWYRIGTSLAAVSDPGDTQGPAVGLLRVSSSIDCNGGVYTFALFSGEGLFPIGTTAEGCGFHAKECVTSGVLPVTARFAVADDKGTGYDFAADLVPLHLVDLNDGIPRPRLDPSKPFCDQLLPALLEGSGWAPGTNVGIVDADGRVLASTHIH